MDNNPHSAFSPKQLKQASLWKNLFGIKVKENAIIAVNNLLASRQLTSISQQDIKQIATSYNVDLKKDFSSDLYEFYKAYLIFCLLDKYLSNQEVQELKCLKDILMLSDNEVNQIHHEVTGELYKMEVEKVIEDGRLSEDEKYFLKEIQSNLKITDSVAEKIYHESANELMNRIMDQALEDNLLTDEEEKELEEIKKSLNVEIFLEGSKRANFEKSKLFWQIENGKLPIVETDLFLENEPCYFISKAEWLEQKVSSKTHSNYNLKTKIEQGIHFKKEDKEMKPELEDIWATMDNGKVYITQYRLILAGNEDEKSVIYSEIIDFTAYTNGISILGTEKSIFLQFKDHIDVFALILGKAIFNSCQKDEKAH